MTDVTLTAAAEPPAGWDTYLLHRDDADAFQLAGWAGVLADAFAVAPCYIQARGPGGEVRGLLPGYAGRSRIAGPHWSSLDGGVLANDDATAAALIADARDRAKADGLRYLLLRGGADDRTPDAVRPTVRPVLDLTDGSEAVLRGAQQRFRNHVRRALELPLTVDVRDEVPAAFYPIFARTQRDLGTPVPPRALFPAMARHLGPHLTFVALSRDDSLIGGMVCLRLGDRLQSLYAATDPAHQRDYANYRLYWGAIEHAAATGCRLFDMGRSLPGSGPHAFKRKWRPVDHEVAYHYHRIAGPVPAVPDDPRPGAKQRAWRRLPLGMATRLGPVLRRRLPFG